MRWKKHESHMGKRGNEHNILVGKPEGKRLIGKLSSKRLLSWNYLEVLRKTTKTLSQDSCSPG
jgi:hypothetical protein